MLEYAEKLGQPYYTGVRFHAFDFQRQDVFLIPSLQIR